MKQTKQQIIKHKLFDIWEEIDFVTGIKKVWKVQLPKGILTFKTKKEAVKYSEGSIKIMKQTKQYVNRKGQKVICIKDTPNDGGKILTDKGWVSTTWKTSSKILKILESCDNRHRIQFSNKGKYDDGSIASFYFPEDKLKEYFKVIFEEKKNKRCNRCGREYFVCKCKNIIEILDEI